MGGKDGTHPATILLIRHGEKPGDPRDDEQGGRDLSPRGAARAVALPTLFLPASSPLGCAVTAAHAEGAPGFLGTYEPFGGEGPAPRLPTPDFVFATANSHRSHRPKQTVRPTAEALGLSVDDDYENTDAGVHDLAKLMRTAPYAGKTVLICWHHGKMQDLAGELGVGKAHAWPDAVFDRVWRIDYDERGEAALTPVGQRLLYGDRE